MQRLCSEHNFLLKNSILQKLFSRRRSRSVRHAVGRVGGPACSQPSKQPPLLFSDMGRVTFPGQPAPAARGLEPAAAWECAAPTPCLCPSHLSVTASFSSSFRTFSLLTCHRGRRIRVGNTCEVFMELRPSLQKIQGNSIRRYIYFVQNLLGILTKAFPGARRLSPWKAPL